LGGGGRGKRVQGVGGKYTTPLIPIIGCNLYFLDFWFSFPYLLISIIKFELRLSMQVASMSNQAAYSGLSILKSANEQPKLAYDLIRKTVEAIRQAQPMQTVAQPVYGSALTGTGTVIDTTA
jgi:hypothetical protein